MTRSPRLVVRTLGITVLMVFSLLAIVFGFVTIRARRQVRDSVTANLESTQRIFSALERRRLSELRAQAATLAESPTLKAAADTYAAESTGFGAHDRRVETQLVATVDLELQKVAQRFASEADAIVLLDSHRNTLAAAGRLAEAWPAGRMVRVMPTANDPSDADRSTEGLTESSGQTFRVVAVPLRLDDGSVVGTLCVTTSLDRRFVEAMKTLFRTDIAIVRDGALLVSTLTADRAREFEVQAAQSGRAEGTATLAAGAYAYRNLVRVGDASVFALTSIDESTQATQAGLRRDLLLTAAGAILIALIGSAGLALQISRPIRKLSQSLQTMAATRNVHPVVPRTGSTLEIDALVETFNRLIASVADAEAETEAAYTGAIKALAAALDARDPYTAGHSERVGVVSVAIARQLGMSDEDREVVRLGALLHDIGKIGIPDEVLRKPGPLTDAEYDAIKQHPVVGARILESVPFLTRHVPIVELHHERPDGHGYPRGLRGDDIPLPARIVHVADAYDAITSARAYRGARPSVDALRELWRCAGTEYDAEIVGALAAALPALTAALAPDRNAAPVSIDGAKRRLEAIA